MEFATTQTKSELRGTEEDHVILIVRFSTRRRVGESLYRRGFNRPVFFFNRRVFFGF